MAGKKFRRLPGANERLKISTVQRAELFGIPEPTWRTWRSGYQQKDGRQKIHRGRMLLFYAIDELTPEQIEHAKKRTDTVIENLGVDSDGFYTVKDDDGSAV